MPIKTLSFLPRARTKRSTSAVLPDAGLSGDDHEPALPARGGLARLPEDGESGVTLEQLVARVVDRRRSAASRRTGRRCRRREVELGILTQHAALQLLELGGRLDPELVVEETAEVLVARERLCVPSGAVESDHLLATETLAQGVTRDEGLEVADRVDLATEGQVCLDPALERGEAQLLEARTFGVGERLRRCET